MERTELLEQIRNTLCNAGFYVSELFVIRSMVFDLVARRDDSLLIIKVLSNIDALSEDAANELHTLASILKASPLLIGWRNGAGMLEDNVVYYRFNVSAITPGTLQNHLLEGNPIKVYAAPGGFYVNLDEARLKELRLEKNISLGTFARFTHVSRKTVQMYEQGMNARTEVASRIEELLEETITRDIKLITSAFHETKKPIMKRKPVNLHEFQHEVFDILKKIGYNIIPIEKCPFEAVSKTQEKILLTCVHKYNNKLVKKAQIVSSISRIAEKHAVVFTDKETLNKNVEGTPIIGRKELKKVRDTDEIFELIIERI